MLILIYSALKSPKGTAVALFRLGAILGAGGLLGLFVDPGVVAGLLTTLSALMVGTGWLLWGGIKHWMLRTCAVTGLPRSCGAGRGSGPL